MNRIYKLALAITLLISSSLIATEYNTIKLKSGDLTPEAAVSSATFELFEATHSTKYAIVQFNTVPTDAEKSTLQASGINLLEYLPHNSFLSSIDKTANKTFGELNVRAAIPYLSSYKYSPSFVNEEAPEYAVFESDDLLLMVEPHLDVTPAAFRAELAQLDAIVLLEEPSANYFEIRISKSSKSAVIASELVKFVDYIPAPPEKEDTRGRSLHRGNLLDSDHPLGRKYDGTGVSLAIADDGLIGPHIDISGRVTQFATVDNGTHGDMTTGIAMGAGNLDPTIKGMATGAYLYYYDIGGYPHVLNAITNYVNRGVVVTSTSYSEGCNAGYTGTTRVVDQQTRQYPEILHVFSAGNSSASTCGGNAYGAGTPWGTITGGRKQGKAVIATGNLDYRGSLTNSSSRGPAADGRIKPDICANGTNQLSTDPNNNYRPGGGTSAAAPGIAGLAVQLYHGYRENNNGADPESGLIKAAMLNTAQDIGNPGPDFYYGWGRVNAHRAMKLMEDNRYLSSTISQNGNNTHSITTTSALKQLRVMVYWTDYEASTASAQALVNNIDMQLVTPNNDTIDPWILDPTPNSFNLSRNATQGVDDLNNVEQVTVDNIAAGTYTVLINGKVIPQGPQKYFVLWETKADEIEVTYPSGGESLVPGTTETIRWDAFETTGSFNIQYSTDNGTNWSTVTGFVSGALRYYDWTVPSGVTGDALIRITRGAVSDQSDYTFSVITTPQNIGPSYICADSINITWNPVAGATEYEVSMLGTTHMDSVGRTTTTDFTLYGLTLSNDNWVSVRALGPGIEGRRANAVILPKSEINCPYDYDFKILQINQPREIYTLSCLQDKVPVQITVNNNGDSALTNIPLRLESGGITYFDTIRSTLNPNAFQFYTFSDSIPVGSLSTINFIVQGDYPNDENPDNDSLDGSLAVFSSQVFNVPYNEDFESFNSCPTTNNCGGTNCNLINQWTNIPNIADDYDMRVNSGGTPSNGTGPSIDQNPGTSTGKYIYSEASNNCYGVESQTLSPCIDLTGTISPELSFWYHMNGTSVGVIRVDVYNNGRWDLNRVNLFGSQGTAWLEQTLDLTPYIGKTVSFRFKVITGSDWSSDIAIDNVSVVDKSVGLNELVEPSFKIYPNPSKGIFNIELEAAEQQNLQVFDMQGRMVKEFRSTQNNIALDLSGMQSGIYFLSIEGTTKREKLILY